MLVRLRYFKELSYDEIAQELNLPIGTVKAQLHRSREYLFKLLSGKKRHYLISIILKYFADLSDRQIDQFDAMYALYTDWNSKINVISEKTWIIFLSVTFCILWPFQR